MKILSFISKLHYNSSQNSKKENAFELPKEIVEKIFSLMTVSEVSRLGILCKDWSKYTQPYLTSLKIQAIKLYKMCEDDCLVPAFEVQGRIQYVFEFHFKDDKITIKKSSDPDFYINTTIDIVNIPIADDALGKKFRVFFCSCQCIDFASTSLKRVNFFALKYNLSQSQKNRIINILQAMNLLLEYRQSF